MSAVHNLLWTSGWDSTYRLMELLMKGKTVRPIYIVIPGRRSTNMEIQKMEEIRDYLFQKYENTKELLLPLKVVEGVELDEGFSKMYGKLTSEEFLGSQYVAFASYAKQQGIEKLELSIHVDDRAHKFLENDIEFVEDGDNSYYRLIENPSNPQLQLFKCFVFPILNISKLEMEKNADRHGFRDVMEMTWFCDNPTPDGTPCGACNPCMYTRTEGMERRVPKPSFRNLMTRKFKRLVRKYVLRKPIP